MHMYEVMPASQPPAAVRPACRVPHRARTWCRALDPDRWWGHAHRRVAHEGGPSMILSL